MPALVNGANRGTSTAASELAGATPNRRCAPTPSIQSRLCERLTRHPRASSRQSAQAALLANRRSWGDQASAETSLYEVVNMNSTNRMSLVIQHGQECDGVLFHQFQRLGRKLIRGDRT